MHCKIQNTLKSNFQFLFLTLIVFLLPAVPNAQSKSQKIALLKNKIDSVSGLISIRRNYTPIKTAQLNFKLDSIERIKTALKVELELIQRDVEGALREFKSLEYVIKANQSELIQTRYENSLLKMELNSTLEGQDYIKKPFDEIEMIFVEGGTFEMGNEDDVLGIQRHEVNPDVLHSVSLNSFNMSRFEITQSQWKSIIGGTPSNFKDCDNCPVEFVNWYDVQEFIRKLNSKTGRNYRLPTEAEWEYAANGGNKSKGYIYSGSNELSSVAWFKQNSDCKTHDIGTKEPNELGIYDMTGNVSEWCSDWHGSYNSMNQNNPTGALTGQSRVVRGSNWAADSYNNLNSQRGWSHPLSKRPNLGFRLVLPVNP